jgi:hypothetical protein
VSFEDVMLRRLSECHAEACTEILASVKAGRSISDAVTDALEALPASKTRELRRWLEDWEAWEEWLRFKDAGWKIGRGRHNKSFLYVTPPSGTKADKKLRPSDRAVAAGANVRSVVHVSSRESHAYSAATGHSTEMLEELTYQIAS